MSAIKRENFFGRTRSAKKVMVLELGFLGDTVHALPMLWMIRQSYPDAELHVTVADHVVRLMDCVPWVDRVWGYMRHPRRATLAESFSFISRMRRKRFDVVINLNGSERSNWLTLFSGGRERLGRRPARGWRKFRRKMFTDHVEYPFGLEPMCQQKMACLTRVGMPFTESTFQVKIADHLLPATGISGADAGTYFHISPFTTADHKELSPGQLMELTGALAAKFPGSKQVFSCGPSEREKKKLAQLLVQLPQEPWRVFAGDLGLPQLAAVIKNSALHFCGDTGTLHLAAMLQTPTVAWFWPNPGLCEWIPAGNKSKIFVGGNPPGAAFLDSIDTDNLVQAAAKMLGKVSFNQETACMTALQSF